MFNNFMDNFQDILGGMGGGDSHWLEPDFLLATIVSGMVNVGGVELGITLYVKGPIITGVMIGEREYLAKLTEIFKTQMQKSLAGLPPEHRQVAEAALDFTTMIEDSYPDAAFGDKVDEDYADEDEDMGDEDDAPLAMPILHMHLKDPVIIHPQPSISFLDSLLPIMRIRLTSIDAWMLGKVDMVPPDFPEDVSGIRH